jgi:NitT/TauT family transport system substrate-binding protein
MTTRPLLVLVLAAVLAVLPGCRRAEDGPATLRLGYFANLSHAQAVLGVATGEYARAIAPARLESAVFNAGPSVVEALFARRIDVAYIGPGPAITAHRRSRGQGVRVVAGAASNGVVVVVRKGVEATALAELRGKRIATPQLGGTQDIAARHFLGVDGIVPVANAEQAALLARGQIDAAWAPEPWAERLVRETGARILAEEKDLWPDKSFQLAAVVTTPEFLAAHGDLVDKLLAAHAAWTDRLAREPDAQAPALGAALEGLTGKRLAEGVLPAALSRVTFTNRIDEETFRTYARWSHELGFERSPIDLGGLFEPRVSAEVRAAAR